MCHNIMLKTPKRKVRRPSYTKGLWGYIALYLLSVAGLEGLSLYFPILLQDVTKIAEAYSGGSMMPLVWQGLLILGFIILIFIVSCASEWAGCLYQNKHQEKSRNALFQKFSKLSTEQIDQIGTARILPTLTNDTDWIKLFNRRILNLIVFFPVAIIGSFIMLFTLNLWYALFAFASLPFVGVFFWLNMRRVKKTIPASVSAYDEYFLNIKDGLRGARDIRLLCKADERSAEFEKHVQSQNRQYVVREQSMAYSKGFTAILFTIITIVIIVFAKGANIITMGDLGAIVVLNTAIQYINKVWTGSHTIFTWFVEYLPRSLYTYQRLDKFYALPEAPRPTGLQQIPLYKQAQIKFNAVTHKRQNGKFDLEKVTMEISNGRAVVIAGGIESGKTMIANLLLKNAAPTSGAITFNEIDLNQINSTFWRRDYVSYCSSTPRFVFGTVRSNFQLLCPGVTDAQIIAAFKELGAHDFLSTYEGFLDYEVKENFNIDDAAKKLLNVVRSILKPAQIYVFNQCFEHIRHDYLNKLMAKMRREKKTGIYITFNSAICKNCDVIHVFKNGAAIAVGRHDDLMKRCPDYRELHTSYQGVISAEAESADKATIVKAEAAANVIANAKQSVETGTPATPATPKPTPVAIEDIVLTPAQAPQTTVATTAAAIVSPVVAAAPTPTVAPIAPNNETPTTSLTDPASAADGPPAKGEGSEVTE